MSLILEMLEFQIAAYWALTGIDREGQPTYASPIDISVRWEEVRMEFISADRERLVSRARVYVDQDVTLKGVLLLGGILTGTDLDDPKNNDRAWEIRHFERLPNLCQDEFLRTVFL